MRPADEIKDMIRHWNDRTSAQMDERTLGDIARALEQSRTQGARGGPHTRSLTMRNPIVKLAIAAAIIAAVVLGLFEFVSTGSTSGVVWAEVAQKVQASRGVIFRTIEEIVPDPSGRGVDFTVNRYTSTKARLDGYVGGEIIKTIYSDCNTKTVILVDHAHKSYVQNTNAEGMPSSFQKVDPNSVIQRFLSCEHRELGQETIDGVLCEGIETTDLAFYGGGREPESLVAHIWVSVETGYPVRFESKIVRDNGQTRLGWVGDQFQWDVELDESVFEPEIPAGYIDISPDEW
jgi:hypothetical protein